MSDPKICRNHPDRPSVAYCQKYNHGYCSECLETDPHCSDPDIYCKFRPQCVVFYNYKEAKRANGSLEQSA